MEFHSGVGDTTAPLVLRAASGSAAVLDVGCGTRALFTDAGESPLGHGGTGHLPFDDASLELTPLGWPPVFDLGPPPLVRAVLARRPG